MKLSKRSKKIVMISAAAVAVIGLGTSTAMAAGTEGTDLKFSYKDATASFQHEENLVRLVDTSDNKLGVRAYLKWADGKAKLDVKGEDEQVTDTIDIDDGAKLGMKLCVTKKGKDLSCSGWETALG